MKGQIMYRLIATDLDETLLNTTDKRVCERNRIAIAKAREAGVKLVLCSGRPAESAQGTLEQLDLLNKKGEYMIGFNGGAITENYHNKILFSCGITREEAEFFFQKAKSYDVCIHIYTLHHVYVWNFDMFGEREFLSGRMDIIERTDEDLDFLKDEQIIKFLFCNTDQDYLFRIRDELSEYTEDFDVTFSSNRYIEFNRKGVTKGTGLKRLADILGIDMSETIAIGDNFNDLAMIRAAGLGVGVANSNEAIKEYCDYICKADCDNGAVAEVIERFVLQ